jgi:hypothetical protein
MKKAHLGLVIAGAGLGLMLVDKFTTPAGGTGGVVYGPTGVLTPVKAYIPVDPTILLVGAGLALWAWAKFA